MSIGEQSHRGWGSRLRLCAEVALAASFGLVGCNDPEPLVFPQGGVRSASCAKVGETCFNSLDCPMGTRCLKVRPGIEATLSCAMPDTGASPDAGDPNEAQMRCVLEGSTPSSAALLEGFGAHAPGAKSDIQRLSVSRDEDGTFRYRAPSNVRFVTCALFSCDPEFGMASTMGASRRVIQNFERCVLRHNTTQSRTGAFDPKNDLYSQPTKSPPCPNGRIWPRYGVLSVGCWAYSDSDIVAASPLLTLETEALGALAGAESVLGCEDRPDGADCVLDVRTVAIGSCVGGECRERCVTATDCQLRHLGEELEDKQAEAGAGGGGGGPSDIETCHWQCDDVPTSTLGVCKRLP